MLTKWDSVQFPSPQHAPISPSPHPPKRHSHLHHTTVPSPVPRPMPRSAHPTPPCPVHPLTRTSRTPPSRILYDGFHQKDRSQGSIVGASGSGDCCAVSQGKPWRSSHSFWLGRRPRGLYQHRREARLRLTYWARENPTAAPKRLRVSAFRVRGKPFRVLYSRADEMSVRRRASVCKYCFLSQSNLRTQHEIRGFGCYSSL